MLITGLAYNDEGGWGIAGTPRNDEWGGDGIAGTPRNDEGGGWDYTSR